MRGMYNQAIDDGDAHMNPAARVGKFNRRNGTGSGIHPLNREELQTVLKTAKEKLPADYPLFLCAPRSGLRKGELIALKGVDLDFNGRFIDVQRAFYRGRITLPKNGRTRRVDMSQQLATVLKDLLSRERAAALTKEMKKAAEERRDAATVVNRLWKIGFSQHL
jgi:integrase